LWTIHTQLDGGHFVPLIFALLENKRTDSYVEVLEALKEVDSSLNPSTVILDFEKAEHKAFKEVFPTSTIHGCLFHFAQSVWRRIRGEKAILALYNDTENPEYARQIRCLAALAFVPIDRALAAYKVTDNSLNTYINNF